MRDAPSFDDFYRTTSARTLRYGRAVVGDPGEAQDLVQEAYARAWRQWGKLVAHPAPEAWLRLVVSRLATDRWRRSRGWWLAINRTGPPDHVRPPGEDSVLLVGALRQLPVNQRQALALHYLFDMSVEDMAREARVPTGTVKSWLSRGRSRLAELLPGISAEELEVDDVA
ncbi:MULTISPECIES: SigE family RNA polymerase sigma factor [Micromonospora]|uniref:RNA polymerase sigma factor n=1 Tax=Micromonospora sicca TaxID=2202420 RepID=A0A317DMW4_9ACTN|nr:MULTISPECIES: SigE family RNA polymerase sigma factor [unclassified Micromonospora]MBM0227225.1 SigE family RNA polymerase sigma factor [Micromonospora sp. ATA51]PWR15702.1 SigE family RNA polymerase sigma factor [Micromonospora sp. 4G51]